MANEPVILDPIQAGCAAGRQARAEDAAAGLEPPARALLLMRAALACAALAETLPGPPQHDAAIARERFVWAFVLGYSEGIGGRGPAVRRARRTAARRAAGAAVMARRGVRIPSTRRRRTLRRPPPFPIPHSLFP